MMSAARKLVVLGAFAALNLALTPLAGQTVALGEGERFGNVKYGGMVGEFSDEAVQEQAMKFLNEEGVSMGVVTLYPSRYMYGFLVPDDTSYQRVLRAVEELGPVCTELKQVLKWESGMLFRAVDRDCNVLKRILLGEGDPLRITVDGDEVELLWVTFRGGFEDTDRAPNTSLFWRTRSGLSEELARRLYEETLRVIGPWPRPSFVRVILRNDAWFLSESNFPLRYPFDESPPPLPTEEEYARSPQASCMGYADEPPSCVCYNCEE